jgi:Fic-DOC domain mobile mystery protein B
MVNVQGLEPYGSTPLDDYSGLRLSHISSLKELYEAEFLNITVATSNFLLKQIPLNVLMERNYLYKVHKIMFSKVWDWAGKKRTSSKSVGVDKIYIDIELAKFIKDFDYWELSKMDPVEVSARIHQKLVYIHPFENGNGRWARLVTNVYLKQKINKIIFWPEQELFINNVFRNEYIQALQRADRSDYQDLKKIHFDLISDLSSKEN